MKEKKLKLNKGYAVKVSVKLHIV